MNNKHALLILFVFLAQAGISLAQPDKMITNRDNYFWQFGIAWTASDDDGQELNPMPADQLHGAIIPTRLYVDRYIYNGWSVEGVLGAQTYDSTKMVNDSMGVNGFLGYFDAALKYSFYKQLGRGALDPYLGAGAGFPVAAPVAASAPAAAIDSTSPENQDRLSQLLQRLDRAIESDGQLLWVPHTGPQQPTIRLSAVRAGLYISLNQCS